MRSILILAITILMFGCAEDKKNTDTDATTTANTKTAHPDFVPVAVATAFNNEFPNATNVKWEQEGEKFEAEVDNQTVIYSADGTRYATEEDMAIDALPDAVKTTAATMGTVKEASKITLADGTTQYEVEVGDKEYIYGEDGTLISTQASDDGDQDDDNND